MENQHWDIVEDRIAREVEALLPHGSGPVSDRRLRDALNRVAQVAFREGQNYALLSLMTVRDVAAALGVSERRVRALAKSRHERFGVGWQLPGTSEWLFRREELDLLRPGPPGRRRRAETE